MSDIEYYLQVTEELISLLQKKIGRDEKIKHLTALLDKRDQLIPSIQPPYSDEDKKIGKKIVQLDKQLQPLLQKVKMEIKEDIKTVLNQKTNMKQYINPYQSLLLNNGSIYDGHR
ncbi:flagellar protein FliT [Heyndrickxia ginsengihumi]|uniref:flagellar protein FliT n=1 Tax=Heyndrickxia ginsengihumi TaxID=363870 RepID=UPI00203DB3BD|nr:flagellar protein FliT [Heyndrickxia ginsengihumi]MCM3024052.1 flagellar protein FliT [Heyndrickxia ginsengihumi]